MNTYTFESLYYPTVDNWAETEEQISRLLRQICPEMGERIMRSDRLINFLSMGDIVLAKAGSKIVGLATMRLNFILLRSVGEIHELIVDEEHRRNGIGRKLVKKLLDRAGIDDASRSSRQVDEVWPFFPPSNQGAIKLYYSLGFQFGINGHLRLALK